MADIELLEAVRAGLCEEGLTNSSIFSLSENKSAVIIVHSPDCLAFISLVGEMADVSFCRFTGPGLNEQGQPYPTTIPLSPTAVPLCDPLAFSLIAQEIKKQFNQSGPLPAWISVAEVRRAFGSVSS